MRPCYSPRDSLRGRSSRLASSSASVLSHLSRLLRAPPRPPRALLSTSPSLPGLAALAPSRSLHWTLPPASVQAPLELGSLLQQPGLADPVGWAGGWGLSPHRKAQARRWVFEPPLPLGLAMWPLPCGSQDEQLRPLLPHGISVDPNGGAEGKGVPGAWHGGSPGSRDTPPQTPPSCWVLRWGLLG